MLNQPSTYKKYDSEDIAFGIEKLSEQVRIAWKETRLINVPSNYRNVTNIVVVAMGGSGLASQIIQVACADLRQIPLTIIHDYNLPSWVSSKTLVVAISYSGGTAEVLHAYQQAKKAHAKMMVITTGGELAKLAAAHKIPKYIFTPGEISKQPRLGLGFQIVGLLGLLERAKLLKLKEKDVKATMAAMAEVLDTCAIDISVKDNPAKTVALELHNRAILIIASEHLVGNAHVLANQINENSKQFATFMEIPELNHHLMEGLSFPKKFFEKFTVLMLDSDLYYPDNKKRYDLTAEIFERQGGQVIIYKAGGKTKLEECGEILQFGSFVNYYLAMLNRVNPIGIPFVDWFKREMGK